jgi:tripartite-type tricarboxylate transporter receptor subunit TctC
MKPKFSLCRAFNDCARHDEGDDAAGLWRMKLGILLLALGLLVLCGNVLAQAWPTRPVKIIVPFAAGGNTDSIARITAERLTRMLGQSFVVENMAGAGGAIAGGAVAKAAPDGNTLLMAPMPLLAVLPTVIKVPFDPARDFLPISIVGVNSFAVGVHKSVPAKNVRELVDYAKANPGKLAYASGGSGSISHLTGVLFAERAGIDMLHVAYKGGGPAVTDLLAGNVQVYFGNFSELVPHAQSGNLRVIAVTGEKRVRELAEVPTVAESGYPDFRTLTWNGLMAPAGTPPAVVTAVSRAVATMAADPAFVQQLAKLGVDAIGGTPAAFADTLKADMATWARAARAANLKFE